MKMYHYLDLARDYLRENGWVQGRAETPQGNVCMGEALGKVTPERAWDSVAGWVNERLGNVIPAWNDTPGRTYAQVDAKLEELSALARLTEVKVVFRPRPVRRISHAITGKSVFYDALASFNKESFVKAITESADVNKAYEKYSGYDTIVADPGWVKPVKAGGKTLAQLAAHAEATKAKTPSGLLKQLVASV